jgi:hypothetical protein
LLLPNEVAHEIAQKLRGSPVTAFGGVGELGLQRLIDPESKGCFAHGLIPLVLFDKYTATHCPSRLRRQRKQRRLTLEMLSAKVGLLDCASARVLAGRRQMSWRVHAVVKQAQDIDV